MMMTTAMDIRALSAASASTSRISSAPRVSVPACLAAPGRRGLPSQQIQQTLRASGHSMRLASSDATLATSPALPASGLSHSPGSGRGGNSLRMRKLNLRHFMRQAV